MTSNMLILRSLFVVVFLFCYTPYSSAQGVVKRTHTNDTNRPIKHRNNNVQRTKGTQKSKDSQEKLLEIEPTIGEVIDLGLSVKWSSKNIGAENVWDVGNYYSWGETKPKSEYSKDTYRYHLESNNNMNIGNRTKGIVYTIGGRREDECISNTKYDVATKTDSCMRIPTYAEIKELITDRQMLLSKV